MRGRSVWWMLSLTVTLAGITAVVSCNRRSNSAKPDPAAPSPRPLPPGERGKDDEQQSVEANAPEDPPLPRLPEKEPPAGLPIVPWGKRGYFPVIRNPQYLTAEQGDRALARDEPVLGLVIGKQARADSTYQ